MYIHNVYIIGGSSIYREIHNKKIVDCVYTTRICKAYVVDTYFDDITKYYKLKHISKHTFIENNEQIVYEFRKYIKIESQYNIINMASRVKQFTVESTGVTEKPTSMNKDEVQCIIKFVVSELVELAQTVSTSTDEAIELVHASAFADLSEQPELKDDVDVIAGQADAAVDIWYYMLNAFAKKNINLDRVFDIVHESNMSKKFPDGTFHCRDDGKVVKPPNYEPADVRGEIELQMQGIEW